LDKIAKIEEKRKAALASLNIKYASADKVKNSFGFIGITFLSSLWGLIILNDLIKLLNLAYEEIDDFLKEKRASKEINRAKTERITMEREDKTLNLDLEEKLDQVHLKLVKACVARKK
jgi:hypothetical protein